MAVTPSTFKARFPEFASVDDALIQLVIDEQSPVVTKMVMRDQDPALRYLVAHILTQEGEPSRSEGGGAGAGQGPIISKTENKLSLSYARRGEVSINSSQPGTYNELGLMETSYGQRFYDYLRRNFSGPQLT